MLHFIKNGRIDFGPLRATWQIGKRPRAIAKADGFDSPPYKLHLGPGAAWVKPDSTWLAVDIDPDRGDIVVDFHEFAGFPLAGNTVEAIYASHTFEHISIYRIGRVLSECRRVLRPGGILRIVVPDPVASIREYLAGNADFPLFARRRERARKVEGVDLTLFECLKGDFVSRNHQPALLGEKLAHQNAWDYDALRADLMRAGFTKVRRADFQDSPAFAFEGTYPSEANERERSLYVEAT